MGCSTGTLIRTLAERRQGSRAGSGQAMTAQKYTCFEGFLAVK
ncbi:MULTISPECIES: hypothetical protein [Streptomycetaceae]|nr:MULTISPECIES: hypothetical protein [Streptomycetaceae]